MASLLDVQRGFRSAVLAGSRLTPSLVNGGPVSAVARLGIYRNNIIGNLTRALRLGFPAVERLVGENFFAAAAQRFIEASPPRTADLNQYGEGFADFLASFEPGRSVPYLPDVARLEWAVSRALHAPPAPALTAEAVSRVPPEHQADLRFRPHPTLSLLSLAYPGRAIWEAVLAPDDDRDARLATIDLQSGGEKLAVLRSNGAIEIEVLADAAFDLARMLTQDLALGDALERTAPQTVAPLLAAFLARGYFAGLSLSPDIAPITQGSMS